MVLRGCLLDDRHDLVLMRLPFDDRRATGLDDAHLLLRDLLDRVAEPCHVIHVDRPDHRRIRVKHVRRVPSTAHADLDDRDVDRRVRELPDCHRCEHLEEAHARRALLVHFLVDERDEVLHLIPQFHEVVVGQALPVDGDALAHMLEMRRRVQAGPHAVCPADRLGHARGGSLAVRAGDVDHAERVLRIAEQVEDHLHSLEIRVRRVPLARTAHDVAFDVVDGGLCVCHENLVFVSRKYVNRVHSMHTFDRSPPAQTIVEPGEGRGGIAQDTTQGMHSMTQETAPLSTPDGADADNTREQLAESPVAAGSAIPGRRAGRSRSTTIRSALWTTIRSCSICSPAVSAR